MNAAALLTTTALTAVTAQSVAGRVQPLRHSDKMPNATSTLIDRPLNDERRGAYWVE